MAYETLLLDQQDDVVLTMTVNRPEVRRSTPSGKTVSERP